MDMEVQVGLRKWRQRYGEDLPATVVSIGNFDGVHLGHQRILRRVAVRAVAEDALSVALTFDPHPMRVLRPEAAPPLLCTLAQRLSRIEQLSVDATLVLPFSEELSRLSPEEFVRQVLAETLRARRVLVGANFRFGHRQAGDVAQLEELGKKYSFGVEIVPPVQVRGRVVSSTAIRDALRCGNVGDATRMLGQPYLLTGQVKPGTGTGRREVVPTLNLAPEQELIPAPGVYVTETWLAFGAGQATVEGRPLDAALTTGRIYRSVSNIGLRPTFDGAALTVESHLFDFSADVRQGTMGIGFWHRLREEKKFTGAAELRAQIESDMARARAFFRRIDRLRRLRRSRVASRPA